MHLGVIGLGRMGEIVVDRTLSAGHDVLVYDADPEVMTSAEDLGADTAKSVADLASSLPRPRRVWIMVPAGEPVESVVADLAPVLEPEDIVVDAGNSHFETSMRRAERLPCAYLDCGTSGGPAAAAHGFSLMVGGPDWAYDEIAPVLDAIATGPDGHAHMGASGSGHYVKMVHNGIEYALMQAYGEGFDLLASGRFDLDLERVARTWNNGAVIRSWLLELAEEAFREEGSDLDDVADYVAGGSTGTWTVEEALAQEVPVPLIYQALAERHGSRVASRFSRRLANRLRHGFGHHPVIRERD